MDEKTETTETEASQRKATDIVLALEEQVRTLTKMVSVYDTNIKIVLDRVNKIYSSLEKIDFIYNHLKGAQEEVEEKEQKIFTPIPASQVIDVYNKPITNKRFPEFSQQPEQISEPPILQPKQEVLKSVLEAQKDFIAPEDPDKKIPIVQKVVDVNGKDCFMAKVSVLNDAGEQVVKTQTSATGKWQGYLKPGKYKVEIVKTHNITKEKTMSVQDIIIDGSPGTLQLPEVSLK